MKGMRKERCRYKGTVTVGKKPKRGGRRLGQK